jgi:E3 ubiquitin-protein ligase BAH
MKFAKTLENTATELPVEWRPYVINYKSLKKCINRIVAEIEFRGLIKQLNADSKDCSSDAQKVEYMFSGMAYK